MDRNKTNEIIDNLLFCVELVSETGLGTFMPEEQEEMHEFLLSLREKEPSFTILEECPRCGTIMYIDNDELIDKMTGEPRGLIRWKCPECGTESVRFK